MIAPVRTTLDLDPDVLESAKEIARARGLTAGQVVSQLVRRALVPQSGGALRNGVPVLPSGGGAAAKLTMKRVNELRDDA